MEQLIPIASKLQDVLGALGQSTVLDLPQIVVVGGQSSGKSSVLEAIVGRSFLPRGHGIVTRRPLILQLYNTSGSNGKDEYGEFLHLPGKQFHDFVQIRKEIVRETERLTGTNKGICPSPIHLKIYSPKVLALTLVDLPGMAKNPVGDQPEDIEDQIRDMSLQYISNPNAIILAVSAANQDLANSDALQLSQAVDPYGNRTVGVLTKLDLMDPGTDASDILQNKVIPLRRGYIAVVNRGQKDVDADVSIRDGLAKEDMFFRSHSVYSRDLKKCGTANLAKALNMMLMHHIRDCLPELKNTISKMMTDVQQELDALGTPTEEASRSTMGGALLAMLSKFATNFGNIIDGRGGSSEKTSRQSTHELFGGARISYIFTEIFCSSLLGVGAFDGLSDEEIRTTICNANGTRPALFVPEISFDILVKRQIARLEQPGIQCVDLVYEELQRIASQSEPSELQRFPVLRDRMVEVVSNLLRRCVGPTQMMVGNLVKIELAYINTSHPDFIGGSRAVARLMEKVGKEPARPPQTPNNQSTVHGATPLSSSSLSHYGDTEEGGTGLMDFIFRGGQKPQVARKFDGPPSIVHLPQVPDSMKQDVAPTERERVEMEVIKSLMESYFSIVRKTFVDMVPKTIMYFLVNHVNDAMQNELVSELYRDGEMGTLMAEAEDIAQRRQTCVEMRDLLGRALEIVNEVRDYNTFK
jgi:dynamin 1-like protein